MTETDTSEDLGEVTERDLLGLLADEYRAGGLSVEVVPATEGAPDQLVLPITMPEGQPAAVINAYFLPGVADPAAMQYFVTLAYEVTPEATNDVLHLIAFVNSMLPVTGFEFSAPHGVLVFRHSHAVSLHPLDPGVVAWSLSMVHAAVANFAPIIGQVAAGGDAERATEQAQSVIDSLAS